MRGIGSLIVAGVAVAALACGSSYTAPNDNGGGGGGGANDSTTASVDVRDNSFSPDSVLVKAGGTVTWSWAGTYNTHNVTFASNAIAGSGDMTSGSFDMTFSTAGTYEYQCTHHAGMTGKVIVK